RRGGGRRGDRHRRTRSPCLGPRGRRGRNPVGGGMNDVDTTPAAVEARDLAYLLPTYKRGAFHPVSGKGARLVDADGKEYWDLLAGIAVHALGYRHPRLVKTLKSQVASLLHVSNLFHSAPQGLLGEKLVKASGLSRAFFCNSGTEANEAALKFSRLANPGR